MLLRSNCPVYRVATVPRWCSTWKLRPRDAFVFSARDDRLGAHRVTRHIERKAAKRVPALRKKIWKKHSRLRDTPADQDRIAIVFRRMPADEFAYFEAGKMKKGQMKKGKMTKEQ